MEIFKLLSYGITPEHGQSSCGLGSSTPRPVATLISFRSSYERQRGVEGLPRTDAAGRGGPGRKRRRVDGLLTPSRVRSGRSRGVGLVAQVGAAPLAGVRP